MKMKDGYDRDLVEKILSVEGMEIHREDGRWVVTRGGEPVFVVRRVVSFVVTDAADGDVLLRVDGSLYKAIDDALPALQVKGMLSRSSRGAVDGGG